MKTNVYKKLYAATKPKTVAPTPLCGAIYHCNGYLVSTDFYMMCKIKHEYEKELEGRIFHSDGKEVMRKYYAYNNFFDLITSMERIDIPDLLLACDNIVRAKDRRTYYISVGDSLLKADLVVKIYKLLGKRVELYFPKDSTTELYFPKDSSIRGCIFSKGDNMVYMCDMSDPSPYTIEEALSLVL